MQRLKLLGLCLCAVWGLSLLNAQAAKGEGPKARFFAKYDTNKNGVIDGAEKDAVRKDYAANKDGELKRFDTNQDGTLSDEELAAIKPPAGKKKSEASGKSSAGASEAGEKSDAGASSKAEGKPAPGSPGAPKQP
ncbi:MAG: hypothetical protein N3I86_03820 [Verrucomicrobiae bacterium]|nr:hypothetical protein [Verrucomicrobiae bacterium]MDW8308057.1 hypothetical protein [Verrucomicrobiales bacterium]